MEQPPQVVWPTRAPIELRCDRAVTSALTRAAVGRTLLGWTGFGLAMGAALSGATVGLLFRSLALGAVVATVVTAFQVGLVVRHARRGTRLTAAPGQVLTTAYDGEGRLVLTTALGTVVLDAGSVDRVRRGRATVAFRYRQSRCWGLLATQLLTADDAAFLLGDPAHSRHRPLTAQRLPLMHVVTPQSQRGVQAAASSLAWRSTDGVMSTIGLLLFLAWAAFAPGLLSLVLAGAMALALLTFLVGPALTVRRLLPVGDLVMADVTERGLAVHQRLERAFLPWPTFRSVRVTRHAVVLRAGTGLVALPRDLFPAGDLGRLQDQVRNARSAVDGG
jgi:YD repeat-containing protein